MTNPLSFDDLIASLPSGHFVGIGQPAFRIEDAVPTFVPPTLRAVERSGDAAATLISARGAVGKSTLARQLSATTQTPLWRLDADVSVSADALETRLGRYIGPQDPVRRFRAEEGAFVIIDALDEARMRVSGTSWAEYLGSIAAVAASGHHFVLLGRERVLEDVWLSLADAGIDPDWFEISHFDPEQRQAYVDGRVQARGHNIENHAYRKARDAVLAALAGTVAGPLSDAFVGYAPVLDAVVALVAEGNLIAVENAFRSGQQDGERIAVLVRVLESLLEREQAKTQPLAEQLELDPQVTYTPTEQLAWLTADLLNADPPDLEWCPPAVRGEYASRVEEFLRDHPFRAENRWASPVFSAYVATQRFGDPAIRGSLRPIGEATGLLFEFVSHAGFAALIDEWQFAALHASLLAAEWQEVEAVVSIAGGETDGGQPDTLPDQAAGELVLLSDGIAERRTPFELVLDRTGYLNLLGRTSFLSVVFPGTVTVGSGESSLTLGPDCFIRCVDLSLVGDTVQVLRRAESAQGAPAEDASVVLEVSGRFNCDGTLSGTPSAESFELRVSAEQRLAYPWIVYRHDLEPAISLPDERAERFLKMLMNLLRRHGRKELAVFDKKLEGRQSVKGDELRNVLSELQAMGVLTVGGPMIYLNDQWAADRFDGKGRPGLAHLEDKMETWRPVLDRISSVLS
ncbi:MAG TPA: hypothetical protein VF545_09035 [Thermoleophilaceae bacterium]|jgi:hypothetical protein